MKILQIFKSFDFQGNKLLNTKTETPTDSEHIVPKQYVDVSTTYDTVKANTQTVSSSFNWLTGLANKSFKEIFDELLFPIKYPQYSNPTFKNLRINVDEKYMISGSKKLIFYNENLTFRLYYEITPSDRISGIVPKIITTDINGNSNTYYGTETSDVSGEIVFTLNFDKFVSIILRKEFQPVQVIRQTNYGIDFIPIDYTILYNLDFDVLKFIQKQFILTETLYTRKLISGDNYVSLIDNFLLSNYQRSSSIYVNGTSNQFIVGIPFSLYTKSILEIVNDMITDSIPYQFLKSNTPLLTNNIKSINGIDYYFGIIDFGSYPISTKLDFKFNQIKS